MPDEDEEESRIIGEATILEDIDILQAANTDRLEFAYPMFENIVIMSSEYLAFEFQPPFYGDTINLQFWKMLDMKMGGSSGTAPLTNIPGYTYKYNHTKQTFDVYDENGLNILHKTNVNSIGDMNVDGTILNSHQFEIILEPDGSTGIMFIRPAKRLIQDRDMLQIDPIVAGINNIYLTDRIRPYNASDVDNPTNDIKLLGEHIIEVKREEVPPEVVKKEEFDYVSTPYIWGINWWKDVPNNDFGRFLFTVDKYHQVFETLKGVKEEPDWLLPVLGVNMYPRLLPILRPGETVINRPVYEPWLITPIPFSESLGDDDDPFDPPPEDPPGTHPPIHTEDEEDEEFVIPVFDYSPRVT